MKCDFYHDLQEQSIYTAGDFQMQYILACQLKDFLIEQTQLIDMHVNNYLKSDLFVCLYERNEYIHVIGLWEAQGGASGAAMEHI